MYTVDGYVSRDWCDRMDNHGRSKKHAENVAKLLLEVGSDDADNDADDENADGDVNQLPDADVDDAELAGDSPDLSQSRYLHVCVFFLPCAEHVYRYHRDCPSVTLLYNFISKRQLRLYSLHQTLVQRL